MKINQKGFSAVEILVAVLIIGLIGAVGWLVYDRQKTNESDTTPNKTQTEKPASTTEAKKSDLPQGYSEYKNTPKGTSIGYPSEWTVDKVKPVAGYEDSYAVFATSDFTKGEIAIGGEGVLTGVQVTLQTAKPEGTNVQEDYKNPKFAADVTNFSLGGEKAVRYFLAYEGAIFSHAVTYKNGVEYDILMHYPHEEGEYNVVQKKYEPIFLKMLETFKFN